MTTEQKIVRMLQMGYSLTIKDDCGRLECEVEHGGGKLDCAAFYTANCDGPSPTYLDEVVDKAYKYAEGQWKRA